MRRRAERIAVGQPQCHGVLTAIAAACLVLSASPLVAQAPSHVLPDSPGAIMFSARAASSAAPDQSSSAQPGASAAAPLSQPATLLPCPAHPRKHPWMVLILPTVRLRCIDQIQLIVNAGHVRPLSSNEKGVLAFHAVADPFNALTIGFFSGISVASDAHSAYGPGFAGWGRLSGYSFVEDAQLEFTGTYLLPTIFHEDPRYHRMPGAPVRRRIEHALIHGFISQHDDGSVMPNYTTLINYPLSDEISNLYVPGLGTNLPSTTKRVLLGYATEPVGPLLAEFLPDVAKRVHIHIIFAQQLLNQLALGSAPSSSN